MSLSKTAERKMVTTGKAKMTQSESGTAINLTELTRMEQRRTWMVVLTSIRSVTASEVWFIRKVFAVYKMPEISDRRTPW